MYYIYIYTPFYNNGNYIPHLIEHCVTNIKSEKDYFLYNNLKASCNTFCTYFILPTKNKKYLNDFIKKILSPINNNLIKYEHNVIKDENKTYNFEIDLVNKIGKKLYGNRVNFNQNGKLSYNKTKDYHKKYYTKENIIILENNIKYFDGEIKTNFKLFNTFKINKEIVYVFNHNMIDFYILIQISDLINEYISYKKRYFEEEYYRHETIFGDYKDYIFLSINKDSLNLYKNINESFIDNFITYNLKNKDYLNVKYFDGTSMLLYGYTLSNNDKKRIIVNLKEYYLNFINVIKF
ncbi:MAG: hypothetical protein Q8K30_00525 [Candidatus Gracilibacteria bacterium]|nr:hypothetical protein [Candidatus Gracilibacteria bacterium]